MEPTGYKAWHEEYREVLGDKREDSNRLFISEYGNNIYPSTINMWMKKVCKSTGLEPRTVHSLRHTNITTQLATGLSIVTVAGRAGHVQTSTTTDIYSHFLKTADRSAAKNLKKYSSEDNDSDCSCQGHFFIVDFLKFFFEKSNSVICQAFFSRFLKFSEKFLFR